MRIMEFLPSRILPAVSHMRMEKLLGLRAFLLTQAAQFRLVELICNVKCLTEQALQYITIDGGP